jgi:hypothetical protein
VAPRLDVRRKLAQLDLPVVVGHLPRVCASLNRVQINRPRAFLPVRACGKMSP